MGTKPLLRHVWHLRAVYGDVLESRSVQERLEGHIVQGATALSASMITPQI
jgi:hypothetical protein